MADALSASETLEAVDRSLSAELAEFLSSLEGRIAPERIATAGNCVIDTMGAIAYGCAQPWSMAAARHALATGGGGACTVARCTRSRVGRRGGAASSG